MTPRSHRSPNTADADTTGNKRILECPLWGSDLRQAIAAVERESGGHLSIAARRPATGEVFEYRAARKVRTASVIKLPILVHVALCVEEGKLSWDDELTLTAGEKVGGSGILTQLTGGLRLPLRDLCTLMVVVSDNTATNMVIERVGVESVNHRMRQLGLPITTLFRKSYAPDTVASKRYGLGVSTAREMLEMLTLIADGCNGSEGAREVIISMLEAQQCRDGIPRLLPAGWGYAGKTGAIDHVRNDVGLVTSPDGERFIISLFCQDLPDVLWTPDNPGLIALAHAARLLVCA